MTRTTLIAVPFMLMSSLWVSGCTLFLAGDAPCDRDADCDAGTSCQEGFCRPALGGAPGGEGEGEGEGEFFGEGEGEPNEGEGEEGEGEGDEGEGEGDEGEGEGEGDVGEGEGEGDVGEGEGEGEGEDPPLFEIVCGEEHPIAPWFDVAYDQRQRVAFCDPGAPDADVVELPVTVVLREGFFDFNDAQDDGVDVIFVDQRDGDGVILPFERSKFDPVAGIGVFFVRVSRFNPHDQLDSIYMYFDNPGAPDESDVDATWEDYASLWHFDNGNGNARLVETLSGTGPVTRGTVADVNGTLGGAVELNGQAASFLRLPPPPGVDATAGSISLFLSPGNNGYLGSGCSEIAAPCGHIFLLGLTQSSLGFDNKSVHLSLFDVDAALGVSRPSNPSTAGSFSHQTGLNAFDGGDANYINVTWTSSRIEITVVAINGNGTVFASTSGKNVSVGTAFTPNNFAIGVSEDNDVIAESANVGAVYEELRASRSGHNGAYMRADGLSQHERLLVYGNAEAQ